MLQTLERRRKYVGIILSEEHTLNILNFRIQKQMCKTISKIDNPLSVKLGWIQVKLLKITKDYFKKS